MFRSLPCALGFAFIMVAACFPELPPDRLDSDGVGQDTAVQVDADGVGQDTSEAGDTEPQGGDTTHTTGPTAPTEVSASTDRYGDVEVRWLESAGAIGYHVERCVRDCGDTMAWARITDTPLTAARYEDTDAAPPSAVPAPTSVAATVDRPDDVLITWAAATAPEAPRYQYRVYAIGGDGESPPSEVAVGHRAERSVAGYEVQVDAGVWRPVEGLVTSWLDADASPGVLTAGTVSASQGTYAELVRLTVSGGEAVAGPEHGYRVRAVTAFGPEASSTEVFGSRSPGALSYAWERSAGSTPDDFAALAGATGTSFDDTTAPADGSVRWYRVVVGADGAADAVSDAAAGSRQPPPNVPGAVTASSGYETHVLVSWQPVGGALGYHVYRGGDRLTTAGPVTTTSFEDTTAPLPGSGWQGPTALAASTDDPTQVTLTWTAPLRPQGPPVAYQVRAVNAAGDGPLSAEAVGRTAAPALVTFEVEVTPSGGTANWFTTGSAAAQWTHADPPRASITGGTAAATQGDHRAHVRLTTSGDAAGQAPSVSYRVRGVLQGGGVTPTSSTATGRRAVGPLQRQWQRSAGVASSGFADLSGATGATYEDAAAPSDGARRWYRVMLSAEGADPHVVGPVEGWRLAFVQVAGGLAHTCARTAQGRVWCWGSNTNDIGGLGIGPPPSMIVPATRLEGLTDVVDIAAGGLASCAQRNDGTTWCWGSGYLGNGFNEASLVPIQISNLSGAASITINFWRGCVALQGGAVRCWGHNGALLGANTASASATPIPVLTSPSEALSSVAEVAMNFDHSCARRNNGDVWCWGYNDWGQLGITPSSNPLVMAVKATAVVGATSVVSGRRFSCALLAGGAVRCWGYSGRWGEEPGIDWGHAGVIVGELDEAVAISAAELSVCARLANGGVRCWGAILHGELGNTSWSSATPIAFHVGAPGAHTSSIGSGSSHHCAVSDGDVYCWGFNDRGQLGAPTPDTGTGDEFSTVPVKVILP